MNELIYLTQSLAWSAGGFWAGWVTSRTVAWKAAPVTHPLTDEERPEVGPESPPEGPKEPPWYKRSRTYLGLVVALIGAFTAIQWWVTGQDTSRLAEETQRQNQCLQAYAVGFADAIDLRSKAQAEVNNAQDRMWAIFQKALVAPGPELKDEFGKALSDYFAGRTKAKDSPPYPDPPRDLCK